MEEISAEIFFERGYQRKLVSQNPRSSKIMSLLRLRLRSALSLSSPINQIRRQVSPLPLQNHSTPISAAYPLPVPRDPSLPPLQLPSDLLSKFDYTSSTHVWSVVKVLTDLSYLDTAAEFARLVVLAVSESPHYTKTKTQIAETCQRVIGGMLVEKRYEEAYELFHYFYNVNCLPPDYDSCCHVLDALSYQGRVDEAMKFYRRVKMYAKFSLMPRAMVKAFINAARIDEAFDFFINGYEFSYFDFIRGYLACGNIDKATEIFEYVKPTYDRSIDDQDAEEIAMSQAEFMEHWFKQGKDKEAMEWYHSALDNGYVSETALKILLKYGKKTEAWSLFDKMCEIKMADKETCCMMIRECIETGETSKVFEIAEKAGNCLVE